MDTSAYTSLDLIYSHIPAAVSLVLFATFAWRGMNGANSAAFMTLAPFGAAFLAGVAHTRLMLLLIVVDVVRLAIAGKAEASTGGRARGAPIGTILFGMVVLAVWLKIGMDCAIGGMDGYRSTSLIYALTRVWLPLVHLYFALRSSGIQKGSEAFLVGIMAYGGLVGLSALAFSLVDGSILNVIGGGGRLTLFGEDTINSARGPYYVVVVALVYLMSGARKSLTVRMACGSLIGAMALILLLTGTRQFVVAGILFGACVVITGMKNVKDALTFAGLVSVTGVIGSALWNTTAIGERFSGDRLEYEASSSRGAIWRDAFAMAYSRPLTGAGFRLYGEENAVFSERRGMVVFNRDSAHGYLQEMFAEHGIVLGTLGTLCFLLSGIVILVGAFRFGLTGSAALGLSALGFALPEMATGTIWRCYGMSLVAALPLLVGVATLVPAGNTRGKGSCPVQSGRLEATGKRRGTAVASQA
ncbi:MAG: O-antigen ligase family protein [Limisphaerales bacterium]